MMMGFGLLFPLLVIGGIAYAAGWRPQFGQASPPAPAAGSSNNVLEILRERYARGEVKKEEYEEMKRTLEG